MVVKKISASEGILERENFILPDRQIHISPSLKMFSTNSNDEALYKKQQMSRLVQLLLTEKWNMPGWDGIILLCQVSASYFSLHVSVSPAAGGANDEQRDTWFLFEWRLPAFDSVPKSRLIDTETARQPFTQPRADIFKLTFFIGTASSLYQLVSSNQHLLFKSIYWFS